MYTGFSLCGKSTQGKPCSGPVRDCRVYNNQKKYVRLQKGFEPILENQNGLTRKHFTWCASIIYAKLLPQVQLRV